MILEKMLKQLKEGKQNRAYTINDETYSYQELYKFVCNIYHFLLIANKEKKPVVVYGHKEIYMKATFLACSFAGITYVPIDNSIPIERVNLIIYQVKPQFVIGNFENEYCKNISKNQIQKIMQNESFNEIDNIYLKPQNTYYIMFTSGSTGTPKGVKVTYSNLNSCVKWLEKIMDIKKEVILNQANFSFDLSVADLYLSTITGSEHYILENTKELDFNKLFMRLKQSNATVAVMTPSFADLLLLDKTFGSKILTKLRTIIFCGEKLLKSTVENIKRRFENLKIINSYGPTECTFAVTSIEVTEKIAKQENIPCRKSKGRC